MTLPNLMPDVRELLVFRPWVLDQAREQFVKGPLHLGFDSWVQNVGDVPFQLTMNSPDAMSPEVSQCVSWTAEYVCREARPVGGFSWHEPHGHFHYDDFEKYEFRRLQADGRPDYTNEGLVGVNDKVGFCLLDSERVSEDASERPFYVTCSQSMQGVSPGWADVYDPTLPGQQFPIEGLPGGRYAIVVTLNVSGHLYETTDSDNRVEITVELSDDLSQATILDRKYQ